jgi:RibD C-terminal domain
VELLSAAAAHLMGRRTYEEMATAWPNSDSVYAKPMNEIPKVVFSKTLKDADWDETHIASGDLAEEIAELKREAGGDLIAHGGASFASALIRERVIDEYGSPCTRCCAGPGFHSGRSLTRRCASNWSRWAGSNPGGSFTPTETRPNNHPDIPPGGPRRCPRAPD